MAYVKYGYVVVLHKNLITLRKSCIFSNAHEFGCINYLAGVRLTVDVVCSLPY